MSLICSRTCLFLFLGVHGICRDLLNTTFQVIKIYFLLAIFIVQLWYPLIIIENTRVWVILALIHLCS